jgi:hypothetical protein
MNQYNKIALASLLALLIIAISVSIVGLATAATMGGYSLPSPILPFFLGSLTAVVILVIGAFKVSKCIVGSENKKDRYVLFVGLSVIFIAIIVWIVSAYLFTSGTL